MQIITYLKQMGLSNDKDAFSNLFTNLINATQIGFIGLKMPIGTNALLNST